MGVTSFALVAFKTNVASTVQLERIAEPNLRMAHAYGAVVDDVPKLIEVYLSVVVLYTSINPSASIEHSARYVMHGTSDAHLISFPNHIPAYIHTATSQTIGLVVRAR